MFTCFKKATSLCAILISTHNEQSFTPAAFTVARLRFGGARVVTGVHTPGEGQRLCHNTTKHKQSRNARGMLWKDQIVRFHINLEKVYYFRLYYFFGVVKTDLTQRGGLPPRLSNINGQGRPEQGTVEKECLRHLLPLRLALLREVRANPKERLVWSAKQ